MTTIQSSSSVSSRAPTDEDEIYGMNLGKYTRLNEIGRGSFATVYRGTHNEDDTFVAVKSVKLKNLNPKLKANLRLEIAILKNVQHPHIVALIDCHETPTSIHLIMEFCALGDLSRFIRKRNSMARHELTQDMMTKYPNPPGGGLNEVLVRHFLKQLSSALEFLRSKHLVHRDIKPQNLLLHPSPNVCAKGLLRSIPYKGSEDSFTPVVGVSSFPMLKIADFGFARSLPTSSLADTLCGSPLYMAPEILRYEKYDAKADLWSVGTVLYEMVAGKPPFKATNHVELLRRIELGNRRVKFPEDTTASVPLKRLIRHLLTLNPVERITFKDFFESSIIMGDIPGLVGEDLREQLERNSVKAMENNQPSRLPVEGEAILGQKNSPSPSENPLIPSSNASQRPTLSRPSSRGVPDQNSGVRRIGSQEQAGNQPAPVSARATSGVSQPSSPVTQGRPASGEFTGRQETRNTPSPRSPSLKEPVIERKERGRQPTYKEASEAERERAAQDIAFERDYVVVEKRAVEVNAFADELAASPRLRQQQQQQQQQYQSPSKKAGTIVRRATTTATPHSSNSAQGGSRRASQATTSRPQVDSTHHRRSSYDRRYGPNPISATSAISKALNKASGRLFGVNFSPPLAITKGGRSPPLGYNPFPTYPLAQSSLVVVGDETKPQPPLDEDTKTVQTIEECATRSDVVYGFAEVKYKQLIPSTPSTRPDTAIKTVENSPGGGVDSGNAIDYELTVDAVLILSEEALVLYVKSLSLLARSMDIAGAWWARKNRGEVISGMSPPKETNSNLTNGNRVNNVVQWVRNRFNEVLQKAEYSRRRLVDAQKQLPPDHPYRISHNLEAVEPESDRTFAHSTDQGLITSGITAEKLMYDRALEMSRTAAINELTGEDLAGCEIAYITAIRMLEAVLESDEVPQISKDGGGDAAGSPANDTEQDKDGVQNEDRTFIAKLVESMRARLRALRKKMALVAKRTSAPPAAPSAKAPLSQPRSASPAVGYNSPR